MMANNRNFTDWYKWGLARYSIHMTATWQQFWNITEQVWNYANGVFLVSPLLIESRSYKNQVSNKHILHHISHITYCIWICKFYKIVVIKLLCPSTIYLKLDTRISVLRLSSSVMLRVHPLDSETGWNVGALVESRPPNIVKLEDSIFYCKKFFLKKSDFSRFFQIFVFLKRAGLESFGRIASS